MWLLVTVFAGDREISEGGCQETRKRELDISRPAQHGVPDRLDLRTSHGHKKGSQGPTFPGF